MQNVEANLETLEKGHATETKINENETVQPKIFTIGSNKNESGDFRDDDLEVNSEVVLRPHPKSEKRRILSTTITPSVYLIPRKNNSTHDLQTTKNGLKKNNSMVLKLIIPPSPSNSTLDNNNYFRSSSSLNYIAGNSNSKGRHQEQTNSINTRQEYPVYFNGGRDNHGYSESDLSNYSMPQGLLSIPATPAPSVHKPDNPTPPEEKKKAFSDILVNTFSIFYALFNITLGLTVYIADIIDSSHPTAEIFSLILVSIACIYLFYLIIDISVFMNKKRSFERLIEKNLPENIDVFETSDGNYQMNIALTEVVKMGKAIKHDYCFNKDRHSTNFYVKIGAAAFCFGHLIHSGLLLGYQIAYLATDKNKVAQCSSIPNLVLQFLYPFYSFMLLYFIFKYSNIIINRNTILARFGIMHCLSSSLCFWIWTIIREVLEAISKKNEDYYTTTTVTSFTEPENNLQAVALPVTMFTQKGAEILTESINFNLRRFTEVCDYSDLQINLIYKDISPYLYPFSVEYSILVVGVLFLVWQNINMCDVEDENEATTQCRNPLFESSDDTEGNVVIHADCQSSNKGLFGGFIILLLTILSSIIFFITVYTDNGSRTEIGVTISTITSLIVLVLALISCHLGYRQITKLDLNSAHHSLLDDILLFICIPAFFLNGFFSIIPAIIDVNVLGIIDVIIEITQVLLQTAFLLDGLRRSSNTKKLRKEKPGRELVTFLIIANISMWLMQTFEVKAHGLKDHRYEYYGKELWTILGHMCLPLMMFYRFHSSVCFCDIWKYAYQPSGH